MFAAQAKPAGGNKRSKGKKAASKAAADRDALAQLTKNKALLEGMPEKISAEKKEWAKKLFDQQMFSALPLVTNKKHFSALEHSKVVEYYHSLDT